MKETKTQKVVVDFLCKLHQLIIDDTPFSTCLFFQKHSQFESTMTSIGTIRRVEQKSKMGKEIYNTVKDYSEYSTIQGIIYIFQSKQTAFGKLFWTFVIIVMLLLGTYWSVAAYNNWQSNPVVTTVKTSAFPVQELDFPAVTICGQGTNEEILAAGFFKAFFKFLKQKGIKIGVSPLTASRILKKKVIEVKCL